jgi:drug/metabolite transporter superfamily protein YnfA
MSIIQTTASTGVAARRRRAPVTPREARPAHWQLSGLLICGVLFSALGAFLLALGMDANRSAAADGQVWILWAVMAGERVEHAWGGSHVVLEVDGVRTDAPLREARRTLRRMLGATAMSSSPWRSLRSSSAMWLLRGVTALLCCGWVATGVALLAQ